MKKIVFAVIGIGIGVVVLGFLGNQWRVREIHRLIRQNQLKYVGLAYHNFEDMAGAGVAPTNAADLEPLLKNEGPPGAEAYKHLRDGTFVFLWHASIDDLKKSGSLSEFVLCYEKDVPEKEGSVLFADGHVEQMTAAEFKAAKKAK